MEERTADCYTKQACQLMEYWLLSDEAEEFTRVDNPTRNMETQKEFLEISAGYCTKNRGTFSYQEFVGNLIKGFQL